MSCIQVSLTQYMLVSDTSIQKIGFWSWVENCETMPAVEISYCHETVVKLMFLQIAQYNKPWLNTNY